MFTVIGVFGLNFAVEEKGARKKRKRRFATSLLPDNSRDASR